MGAHLVWKQGSCDPWANASRPTGPHPKDGGEMLIAIVLDRPLAEAEALVDDPAAFTQEWLRFYLKIKVIHSLRKWSSQQEVVTYLPQPAPPWLWQPGTPQRWYASAVSVIANSNCKQSTWGTHGCHLLLRDHCAMQVLSPWGPHGWLVLSDPGHPYTFGNWLRRQPA